MERWTGRVALVTGASVGIGAAIVKELVKYGMTVVGCARRVDKIQAICEELKGESGSLKAVKCDLRNEGEILEMFKEIRREYGALHVLINNAGLGLDDSLLGGETDNWRCMLEVNVLAPTICTREAYAIMKDKGIDDGQIINISSMSGHRVINRSSVNFYSATKFALRALNEGLRNELRSSKTHIRNCEISPGLVDTEFQANSMDQEKITKLMRSLETLKDKDVANTVIFVLSTPPHVQVHDILLRPTEQIS